VLAKADLEVFRAIEPVRTWLIASRCRAVRPLNSNEASMDFSRQAVRINSGHYVRQVETALTAS
jgi:hypothetical protein